MHREGSALRLSATDVANHLACAHLTQLDRAVAEGQRKPPAFRDPSLDLLRERGLVHERAYVQHLRDSGLAVMDLRGDDGKRDSGERLAAADRTIAAMRAGADAIVQADLGKDRWVGRADVLLKVPAAQPPGRLVLRGGGHQAGAGNPRRNRAPALPVLGPGRRGAGAAARSACTW